MTHTSAVRSALVAVALAAAGCAGPVKNMRELPPEAAPPVPAAGKALIIFMRPSGLYAGRQSSVFEVKDGRPQVIGILAAKAKVAHQADPGQHLFMVIGKHAGFMTADVVAGKTYYAVADPHYSGLGGPGYSLVPVAKAALGTPELDGWVKECRWTAADESTTAWAAQNATSIEGKYSRAYPKWLKTPAQERAALGPDDGR
jgi:hypothetical protein